MRTEVDAEAKSVATELLLFSTSGCHLCSQAERLIREQGIATLHVVEITADPELLERYGVRIPVLKRLDTTQELDWPFTGEAVCKWLQK